MLPLFRKQLRIAIGIDHFAVSTPRSNRFGSGFSKKTVFEEQVSLIEVAPIEGRQPWETLVSTLAHYIEQQELKHCSIDVTLSNHFLRYALIPWSDQIQQNEELQTLAQIEFESLYGKNLREWTYCIDMAEFGRPGIACAIETQMIDTLQKLCTTNQLKLISLQSFFVYSLNQVRKKILKDGLFVFIEGDLCILASWLNNTWNSVRTIKRNRSQFVKEFTMLIEREKILQDLPNHTQVYFYGFDFHDAKVMREHCPQFVFLNQEKMHCRSATGILGMLDHSHNTGRTFNTGVR